jgi:hypothetical protein
MAQEYEISTDSLNFGKVEIGSSSLDSLIIRNIGTDSLRIDSVQLNSIQFQARSAAQLWNAI